MAVVETLRGLGSWSLSLATNTPKSTLDALKFFGHIVIHTGRLNIAHGDALLKSGRYTGVYVGRTNGADAYALSGQGMALWLGDSEDKGDIIEAPLVFNNTTFQATIRALLPNNGVGGAVTEGNIANLVGKNFTGSFQYTTRRKAIDYVCQTVGGCAWKVNGDATLDAGLESDLFQTVPKVYVLRNRSGQEMFARALAGEMSTDSDVDDFTTRVLLLAEGEQAATVTATKDILVNPFKDIRGNPVKRTRIISESTTDATNADARAQLQLNRFTGSRDAISLSSSDYDISGDVEVGDYLNVYDPEIGVVNALNEVYFNGEVLYPMQLRLTELNWPVSQGMSAAFRDNDGNWYDLTDYLITEGGSTTLTVGGYNRAIVGPADGGPAGTRPIQDTSVPAAPTWNPPFPGGVYQADDGTSRAQVQLQWNRPNNIDGSTILDGAYFEIRYRSSSVPLYRATHAMMATKTHTQLAAGTYGAPIVYTPGNWQYMQVGWDQLSYLILDLPTNMPYEAQIRAVDAAVPPNAGAWSTTTVWQTSGDIIPPSAPAPPTVAVSTLAVLVRHDLGQASGGTFNLEADLQLLELHGGATSTFAPDATTLIGKMQATYGMLLGQIPAVATMPLNNLTPVYFRIIAVDADGNRSGPSTSVMASAVLVDSAHISDLTASKITAGTISSQVLVSGSIKTGNSPSARTEMNINGIEQYDASNILRSYFASNGDAKMTGTVESGSTGNRIQLSPKVSGTLIPEIRFFPTSGSTYSYINAPNAGAPTLGINSGSTGGTRQTTLWLFENTAMLGYSEVGTGNFKGGRLLADATSVNIERLDTNGVRNGGFTWNRDTDWWAGISLPSGSDAFIRININTEITLKGYFQKDTPEGGASALFVGRFVWGGGSASVGYGATMQSNMTVIAQWTDYTGYLSGTVVNVFNDTFTGFQIGNGTAARNGHYGYWVFRHL